MSSVNVLSQPEQWELQDSLESLSHSSRLAESPGAILVREESADVHSRDESQEAQGISSDLQGHQARHLRGTEKQTGSILNGGSNLKS